MASNDIGDWYRSIPQMTKYWFTGSIILPLVGKIGIISPVWFILNWDWFIYKFQIWRPLTAVLYYPIAGPKGFHFLLNLYFLYSYSTRLETGIFDGRPADYLFMLLFNWICLTAIGFIANLMLLMDPMVLSVLYVWCQLNKDQIVTFWFGTRFKAMYLPWVLLAFNMIIGDGGLFELATSSSVLRWKKLAGGDPGCRVRVASLLDATFVRACLMSNLDAADHLSLRDCLAVISDMLPPLAHPPVSAKKGPGSMIATEVPPADIGIRSLAATGPRRFTRLPVTGPCVSLFQQADGALINRVLNLDSIYRVQLVLIIFNLFFNRYKYFPNRRGGVAGFGMPPSSRRRPEDDHGGRHAWGQGNQLGDD
ncbi:derlin-1-like [Gigantopelta aegis]|uniref:derlin-1-like n=1 Tax=Gigantopelta aegis TaxID=1735272 RepID=UPI001B88C2D2|nr:derlin-1-like [Gigantopelta aegis]